LTSSDGGTDDDDDDDNRYSSVCHEEVMQKAAEMFGLARKELRKKRREIRAAGDREDKHFNFWRSKAYKST